MNSETIWNAENIDLISYEEFEKLYREQYGGGPLYNAESPVQVTVKEYKIDTFEMTEDQSKTNIIFQDGYKKGVNVYSLPLSQEQLLANKKRYCTTKRRQ